MSQDSLFGSARLRSDTNDPSEDLQNLRGTQLFQTGDDAPLAARMRPRALDEVLGQGHLLDEGKPLRRLVEGFGRSSVILYGPPGTGKTTIASLIAAQMNHNFVGLSALDSGVKQVREVITVARRDAQLGKKTVLFLDEVHRFSKTQQDALLAAVENQTVLLVAATTENPSFSVVSPLLSRSLLLTLQPLDNAAVAELVRRAVSDNRGLARRVEISDTAVKDIVRLAGGDARRALTYLEAAAESALAEESAVDGDAAQTAVYRNDEQDTPEITADMVAQSVDKALVRYDRDGDQHYDVSSALIKSIRGSDVDAGLHYLARMIEAGEDPRFIARRLVILASEDIGMADPQSLQVAVAAAQAVQLIGMPEGKLTLAQAVIHLATAPKSASVYQAITAALGDVRAGKTGMVPAHLRDGHYQGAKRLGNAQGYVYPHDDPRGVVKQQYIPDGLGDAVYYQPTDHGNESRISEYLGRLRRLVRGKR